MQVEPIRLKAFSFYTIGHAARSIDGFVSLLKDAAVELLVDVRSVPRSRNNPQYNGDSLPDTLKGQGVDYLRIPALGGFRAKSKTVPLETNAFWTHNSFHSYADYALDDDGFKEGLNTLLDLGQKQTAAIMCAELLWWRCHRRIITDYLLANNQRVFHIIGKGKIEEAKLTPNAKINSNGRLEYSPQVENNEQQIK